jgi:chorismate lyase/3-hydroxybenzoate synthase
MIPFTVCYCDDARTAEWLDNERLLALIRFREPAVAAADPRVGVIALAELGGTTTAEIWLSTQPVQSGVMHGVGYARNGAILFLQFRLDEYSPDALQPLTAMAYRRLFAAARALGYPHLLRVWNYFPAINQESEGLERYRAFCAGRHQALVAELADFETHLPAASAVGTRESGLRLYALAGKEAGIQIENPRQVSAFRYPRQYGLRSPSFSRAMLKTWGEGELHLYISGTASIVGHASQHADLLFQLDETLLNLEVLLAEANRRALAPLRLALLKVYVRPDLEPTPLRGRIAQAFGTDVPMLFLRADICRRELLIEIEGLATSVATHHRQDRAP